MNLYQTLHTSSDNLFHQLSGRTRKRILNSSVSFGIAFTLAVSSSIGQKINEWPGFHGAGRKNKSAETGLIKDWPKDGPKFLLAIQGLGEGYSSVSIAGGLLYTSGSTIDQTYVYAFDLNGKLVWKKPNGKAWTTTLSYASSYTGSRSTPTFDDGIIFHLGETGRLTAYNSKNGEEIWSRDLVKDFDARPSEYGYSESVLVDGDYLYTRPAGKNGFVVCLDKLNGKLIWANTDIPGTEAYSSLIINESGGNRQVIGSSSNCYFGLDAGSGRLLWKVNFANQRELNLTDAIVFNEYVFMSSGYGKGSMLFKLRSSGKEIIPEIVWQTSLMDNHHGGIILYNGYLYGSGSNSRGWFCLDFQTGKQLWNSDGKGSLTFADGMLYLLDEKGTMKLVRATSDKYELHGEFKVPAGGKGPFWAHPVVFGGRLYIRHSDKLFVYDISGK
jgi:outer membrane protein assembly factor BamB